MLSLRISDFQRASKSNIKKELSVKGQDKIEYNSI